MADSLATQPIGRTGGIPTHKAPRARLAAGSWLTDTQVRSLARTPGKHRVGPRTLLVCERPGRAHWEFRFMIGGKARSMGLGPYPTVTLAEARAKAEAAQKLLADCKDPLAERLAQKAAAAAKAAEAITFGAFAKDHMNRHQAGWRNPKHRQQWRNTLATFAYPVIGSLPIGAVTTEHVLQVLRPIWNEKPETASRLRGRIENILDAAKAHGRRTGENPAAWKGNLKSLLPAKTKVHQVKHHAALPWQDMPEFLAQLRQRDGIACRALEFAILTAARSGEVRGATWNEVDLDKAIWTVPDLRMKARREHRVPLSDAALQILREMESLRSTHDNLIFPGMKRGTPLSDMTLGAVLRRMGRGATPHGFRSTFRDWCAEATNFPREVAEAALAHTLRDKVEAAYQRRDLLDKRRGLMNAWAAYCCDGKTDDSA